MTPDRDAGKTTVTGAIFVTAALGLMVYLAYSALQGEHGLLRLFEITAQESLLRDERDALAAERAVLEHRTRALSTEALDPDLLDAQARKMLALGHGDEMIIR